MNKFINDINSLASNRSVEVSVRLQNLNYDCLRKILNYLDLASQFSLLKTSKHFRNAILYDCWNRYNKSTFDIGKDRSMEVQPVEFQIELLDIILTHFKNIKGIPSHILEIYLTGSELEKYTFLQISSLEIIDRLNICSDGLNLKLLEKFPNLKELHLTKIFLDIPYNECFPSLKILKIESCVLNIFITELFKKFPNLEEFYLTYTTLKKSNNNWSLPSLKSLTLMDFDFRDFYLLQNIVSDKLEKLSLFDFNLYCRLNLTEINKSTALKELTLSLLWLDDQRLFESVMKLPSLEILTLDTNYDVFNNNGKIQFYKILEAFQESGLKYVDGLQFNCNLEGFFESRHLENIREINWMEWKCNCYRYYESERKVIQTFYDFVLKSINLETLFLSHNVIDRINVSLDLNFEEQLQKLREENNLKSINIVKTYKNISDGGIMSDLPAVFIRFYIKKKVSFRK